MAPSDAVQQLAPLHNALGVIRGNAGNLVRALHHYREAIRYTELAGDVYNAANIRYNVANDLACAGRFPDAWEYALAALRNFQTYGASAQQEIQKTLDLIADIDKAAGAG